MSQASSARFFIVRYLRFIRCSSTRPPLQCPLTTNSEKSHQAFRVASLNHFSLLLRHKKTSTTPMRPQHLHVSPNKSSLKPSTSIIRLLVFVYIARRWMMCWILGYLDTFFASSADGLALYYRIRGQLSSILLRPQPKLINKGSHFISYYISIATFFPKWIFFTVTNSIWRCPSSPVLDAFICKLYTSLIAKKLLIEISHFFYYLCMHMTSLSKVCTVFTYLYII